MQRFRGFLHLEFNEDRMKDQGAATGLGFRERYLPDELAPFDEVEYARPLDEDSDLVISLALEEARVERILIGWAPVGDDDADVRALPDHQLTDALSEHGDNIVALLSHLTSP